MTADAFAANVPTHRPSPARVAKATVEELLGLCRQFALPEPAQIDSRHGVGGGVGEGAGQGPGERMDQDAGDGAVSVVAQWPLPDDRRLILTLHDREHSELGHWSGELSRMCEVAGPRRVLLDWPMHELHRRPLMLLDRLRRLGVGVRAQRRREAA